MKERFSKKILFCYFLFIFFPLAVIFAQIESLNLEKVCHSMEEIEAICNQVSVAECRQFLEKCENYLNEKSKALEEDISKTQKEKQTLSSEINNLKKRIQDLDYQVQRNNLFVKNLTIDIKETQAEIEKTSKHLQKTQSQLKTILRGIQEKEQIPTFAIIIAKNSLSEFFDEIFYLETLSGKVTDLVNDVKRTKSDLEEKEGVLTEKKTDLENLIKIQILQKKQNEEAKKEKDRLLKITETEYQKQLKEKQKIESQAAKIRSRIFELVGVPKAPTFGQAYEIAKFVEKITGVRSAFLLAVLTQESNIGRNVGQCYLTDTQTGSGINVKTGALVTNVMKPSRDIGHFLEICQKLARDPFKTPVSCPLPSVGGWGGAMGPAQFIPSTWVRYESRIQSVLGKTPDPWQIKDSFLAAGILLADLGASKKDSASERKAALLYFSGTVNSRYNFYADSVLSIAQKYEQDIKVLEQAG